MKKILTILLATATAALAQTSTAVNDQIAIQLGAIQMGYTTPFVLTASSNATVNQQACNALVQGRKAMTARASSPGVNVQGAANVPAVDSVEFRDQLYQAVENVVTTPLKAMVSGVATLVGGKKVSARASLNPPPNSWMVPVPFALEARSSADVQALRDELVDAGVLTEQGNGGGSGGNVTAEMVIVQGGTLPQVSELAGQMVATFQIGKYEVTWGEWQEVRTWAVSNGYSDLAGVGAGSAGNHPVSSVSWYDVLKWCNAKSQKMGLTPVYQVSGAIYKTGEILPSVNALANGYRLPLEKEWEWAARGGVNSQGYNYSGSNDVNAVAWYQNNAGGGTKAVGTKVANELGIYDMSGNLGEWCQDFEYIPPYPYFRGGGWNRTAVYCSVSKITYTDDAADRSLNLGFRLTRNAGN